MVLECLLCSVLGDSLDHHVHFQVLPEAVNHCDSSSNQMLATIPLLISLSSHRSPNFYQRGNAVTTVPSAMLSCGCEWRMNNMNYGQTSMDSLQGGLNSSCLIPTPHLPNNIHYHCTQPSQSSSVQTPQQLGPPHP